MDIYRVNDVTITNSTLFRSTLLLALMFTLLYIPDVPKEETELCFMSCIWEGRIKIILQKSQELIELSDRIIALYQKELAYNNNRAKVKPRRAS